MAADAIIFCVCRDLALVKPVDRFWRVIRQNACFGTRSCLLRFRNIIFQFSSPKIAKTPNFGHFNAFPMENKNANNFWTVSPITMKFGTQSLMRVPKVPYAQQPKKLKIQDAYFCVCRDRTLVKPVDRFWRVIRQNACFGTRSCLLGIRKINISVFTP